MDANQFREFAKTAVDFVADYLENIRDLDVLPSVSPGYLSDLLPNEIPEKPENWQTILEDIKRVIVPGITHWQSPNFHAYYPSATSYPSIVGEMFSAAFSVIGFTWMTSPVCTELEVIVMDWLAKFLNLPDHFLNSNNGPGGGLIQGTSTESILVAILSAREQTVRKHMIKHPELTEADIRGRLVAYSSDQSNSCIERNCLFAAVPIRLIPTSDDFILYGRQLETAVQEDLSRGKIPIICIATTGTTATCAFDDLTTVGPVCQKYDIWLHLDAAYAGVAFCLPECKELLCGMEHVDSLNFNLHKSLKVNFDCTAMWLKNSRKVVESFMVNRIYLNHEYQNQDRQAPDFRHWEIPLGRRFRALKVWITLRTYGTEMLREDVRHHFALSRQFEEYILGDARFELACRRNVGLVCFRVKADDDNRLTELLLKRITNRKKLYLIQAKHNGKHFLRFSVSGMDPKPEDIEFAWTEISTEADEILRDERRKPVEKKKTVKQMTDELETLHLFSGADEEKSK